MRFLVRSPVLLFAISLAGCATAVLETRTGASPARLAPHRTLVVADVAEPDRSAIEDAVVACVKGAVASHRLPGSPTAAAAASLGPDEWDGMVLVRVADARIQQMPDVSYESYTLENLLRTTAPGGVSGHAVAWLYLDVSVLTIRDRVEIIGLKVRSDRGILPGASAAEEKKAATKQAAETAEAAARRLAEAGIFDASASAGSR